MQIIKFLFGILLAIFVLLVFVTEVVIYSVRWIFTGKAFPAETPGMRFINELTDNDI